MSSEEVSARPEQIGKYRIVGTLGQGAMGRVYLGEDPHIGRKVAVKVLAGATGDEARARFLEEARTIGHLSHPEIVTLLEFGFHEGQPFLVMEHLEGESFDHWLAQGPTERRVLEVLQALCRAVAYAHGQGVLHRDVKPSNVQVLADGRAKLLDFGIARTGSVALTATGMLMGTPQYLAPEVLEGKGHSRASDVYAVALVAYEALAGLSPFAADTLEQCLKRVLIEAPKPLEEIRSDLPSELCQAVMDAMAKDPAARPTGVEPLLAALGHALGSAAPEALDRPTVRLNRDAVPAAESGPRPRRPPRGRALWLAAGAAGLAAVTIVGWLALSSDRVARESPGPGAGATPERPFEEEIGGKPPSTTADRPGAGGAQPEALSGARDPVRPGPAAEAPREAEIIQKTTPPARPAVDPENEGATSGGGDGPSVDAREGSTDREANRLQPARQEELQKPRIEATDPVATEATSPEPEPTISGPEPSGATAGDPDAISQRPADPPATPIQGDDATDAREPASGQIADEEPKSGVATAEIEPPEPDLPPAPALERLAPSVIRRGALVTLELDGSGFEEGTRVEVRRGTTSMQGIEVRRLRLRDSGRLRVTLYVAPDVPLGLYSLVALDANGTPSNSLGLEVSL